MKGVGIRLFSQVSGVEEEQGWEGKARSLGASQGQEVAARCAPSWKLGVQRAWAGLGGLRMGWPGGREPLWDSRIGPAGHLTDGVPRRLGSGRARGTREAVKRVP